MLIKYTLMQGDNINKNNIEWSKNKIHWGGKMIHKSNTNFWREDIVLNFNHQNIDQQIRQNILLTSCSCLF